MPNQDMLTKVRQASGFIAALDQSGGSTPGALKGYGYKGDEWSSDEEMFGLIHKMRTRIVTSPSFTGEKILGAPGACFDGRDHALFAELRGKGDGSRAEGA